MRRRAWIRWAGRRQRGRDGGGRTKEERIGTTDDNRSNDNGNNNGTDEHEYEYEYEKEPEMSAGGC